MNINKFFKLEMIFVFLFMCCVMILPTDAFAAPAAPADTENVPILRKKDRKKKQILSYIILTISLSLSLIIKDHIISNMIIFGMLIQTITITRFAYKITKNKYGYELYESGELVL